MKWRNVNLIWCRELKDQLRDRRTLFTVLVLPLLLYPLLGMALLQVAQFSKQDPIRIWIVGAEHLPASPPLIIDGQINSELIAQQKSPPMDLVFDGDDQDMLKLVDQITNSDRFQHGKVLLEQFVREELAARQADLAVIIWQRPTTSNSASTLPLPRIELFHDSARDKSSIASRKFNSILERFRQQWTAQFLSFHQIDASLLNSFHITNSDVADSNLKKAATWSKILPFIVMIWSLTGAFYPAVDLCAGEKERGTFETLLSSPALRNEIAIGKLLTVITFSMVTSLLNLLSMGFTGIFVMSRLGAQMGQGGSFAPLGLPPISSLFWLVLALIPISALFSAVALAAASFAKSSKEGQYYLVPLMMISMPLMMLPMMPAAKLDLGSSLIPVSGLMLMLRGLIEGQHEAVLKYFGPVVAVTLICCWLAIRWVVVQFSRESVIFRPSERFSVNIWLKQVMRERADLPLAGQAILCGVVILVVKFFMGLGVVAPESWLHFAKQTLIVLVAAVAMPAVLMAMFLTRNPLKSLKLSTCRIPVACAAILAAIFLHPCMTWLTNLVLAIYPPTGDLEGIQHMMSAVLADAPGFWAILLILAVAPAVAEELAFRGFILSGLQSLRNNIKAVIISSILFGAAHTILQQSIVTFFIGCILGFIAVRTRSLIPCMLYHATHNGLSISISMLEPAVMSRYPLLQIFFQPTESGGFEYALMPALDDDVGWSVVDRLVLALSQAG